MPARIPRISATAPVREACDGVFLPIRAESDDGFARHADEAERTVVGNGHEVIVRIGLKPLLAQSASQKLRYALAISPRVDVISFALVGVKKLEEELQTVLGGRAPNIGDLPQLRYTERVVTESLRLYPPAYGIAREALADCEIGGCPVPAGTTLFLLQWVVHRDPRFYEASQREKAGRTGAAV